MPVGPSRKVLSPLQVATKWLFSEQRFLFFSFLFSVTKNLLQLRTDTSLAKNDTGSQDPKVVAFLNVFSSMVLAAFFKNNHYSYDSYNFM